MKEAQQLGCEKIYPKKWLSEDYLRKMPDDKVLEIITAAEATVQRIKSAPKTQATLTTILVDSLCEYKQLASLIVRAVAAVVIAIISGGSALSMIKDLAENGARLAGEMKRLDS